MAAYDIALFFHLIGLVAMFGGFAVFLRVGMRLRAATDLDQARMVRAHPALVVASLDRRAAES